MTNKEKNEERWLISGNPDAVSILVEEAPLHYGYLIALEYEGGEILLASSRNPAKYLNSYISREKSVGGDHPVHIRVSQQLWRYEAVKRVLQKRLIDYRTDSGSRFCVPDDVFQAELNSVLSLARVSHYRRKEDVHG